MSKYPRYQAFARTGRELASGNRIIDVQEPASAHVWAGGESVVVDNKARRFYFAHRYPLYREQWQQVGPNFIHKNMKALGDWMRSR